MSTVTIRFGTEAFAVESLLNISNEPCMSGTRVGNVIDIEFSASDLTGDSYWVRTVKRCHEISVKRQQCADAAWFLVRFMSPWTGVRQDRVHGFLMQATVERINVDASDLQEQTSHADEIQAVLVGRLDPEQLLGSCERKPSTVELASNLRIGDVIISEGVRVSVSGSVTLDDGAAVVSYRHESGRKGEVVFEAGWKVEVYQ